MSTFNMFIGSNNTTKVVELDKIVKELDKHYDGYTIANAQGVWKGEHEDSVVVTVVSEYNHLGSVVATLKEQLEQDSIAVQQVNELEFL